MLLPQLVVQLIFELLQGLGFIVLAWYGRRLGLTFGGVHFDQVLDIIIVDIIFTTTDLAMTTRTRCGVLSYSFPTPVWIVGGACHRISFSWVVMRNVYRKRTKVSSGMEVGGGERQKRNQAGSRAGGD